MAEEMKKELNKSESLSGEETESLGDEQAENLSGEETESLGDEQAESLSSEDTENVNGGAGKRIYHCPICLYFTTNTKRNMERHIRMSHSG